MRQSTYIAIDLKSFYASVECVERGLDPLNTNLVVADSSRTDKTICLAVTPSLKSFGVSSRPRLFEVNQKVKEINNNRFKENHYKQFKKDSVYLDELLKNKDYKLSFIIATPQMSHYMEMSNKIYSIYLRYFSKNDIHVYSIDEVFIDVTSYLNMYKCNASTLVSKIIQVIFKETGITATAGIGTNLFLAKVAMDIIAKHSKENKDGVRIGELNEFNFRRLLWDHKPITDIWRIGPGIARRLETLNLFTLGDVALKSIENEDELYKLIGINAELLIDHAWGVEPVAIKEIKSYKPRSKSISIGQVLSRGYNYEETLTIIKEMSDDLVLALNKKKLLTSQIVMSLIYDEKSDLTGYSGLFVKNFNNKIMPYPAHSTINIDHYTNSFKLISEVSLKLYKNIVNRNFLIRRIFLVANTIEEKDDPNLKMMSLDLFDDYKNKEKIKEAEENERKLENTIIKIKEKFGKNSILKGNNLLEEGTQKIRNSQIGGHKA